LETEIGTAGSTIADDWGIRDEPFCACGSRQTRSQLNQHDRQCLLTKYPGGLEALHSHTAGEDSLKWLHRFSMHTLEEVRAEFADAFGCLSRFFLLALFADAACASGGLCVSAVVATKYTV